MDIVLSKNSFKCAVFKIISNVKRVITDNKYTYNSNHLKRIVFKNFCLFLLLFGLVWKYINFGLVVQANIDSPEALLRCNNSGRIFMVWFGNIHYGLVW